MTTTIEPTQLPTPIRDYLAAHDARDGAAAVLFAPDATVTDDGRTYRGTAEIVGFLRDAGSEFTYTTELRGAEHVDDAHWVVHHHIEGDFPGGVADLAYRFTIADGLITELVIAP